MKQLITLFCFFLVCQIHAQKHQYFSKPMESFSIKKTSYITLSDGTEIEGNLKRLKRKKGLIESIKIKLASEEVVEYPAADIKQMYLPESALNALGSVLDESFDATQWNNSDLNAEHLKDGYAYFEATNTQIRKKEGVVLLQLLNPAFSNNIKIYHDPFAGETAAMSVGGINVAGGVDKSYFVKKGDDKAERVMKKNYKDFQDSLYGDCQKMKNYVKKEKKLSWSDFPEHIFTYAKDCSM